MRNAIHEFDPAVDELPDFRQVNGNKSTDEQVGRYTSVRQDDGNTGGGSKFQPVQSAVPTDAEGNSYGKSFQPSDAEFARSMAVRGPVSAGDAVVADRENPGLLKLADQPEDPAVVGIVAGEPGVMLGARRPKEIREESGQAVTTAPVAFSGIVLCKADASYGGAIHVGDLLTTSSTPGHAMKAGKLRPGTVIGKALEPLESGTGMIRILVMLR